MGEIAPKPEELEPEPAAAEAPQQPRIVEIAYRSADYVQNICLKDSTGSEKWHGGLGAAEDQPSFWVMKNDSLKSVTQFGHKIGRLGKGFLFKTKGGEEI